MISCIKIPTLAYQDMSCNDLARGYDGDRGNLGGGLALAHGRIL
jgi:hypothetical protein